MSTPAPPSAETVAGMVERLRAGPRFGNGRPVGDQAERGLKDDAADTIETLAASLVLAEGDRDAAVLHMSEWARKAGIAQGEREASEMAGVVDGWIERATTAEAQAAELQERVRVLTEAQKAVFDIKSPDIWFIVHTIQEKAAELRGRERERPLTDVELTEIKRCDNLIRYFRRQANRAPFRTALRDTGQSVGAGKA